MTDSNPESHLLRPTGAARQLSESTGMQRLALTERRLASGDRCRLRGAPDAAGFLYVLTGAGRLGTMAETIGIGRGDFIGLAPGEQPVLENPHDDTLTVLVGFSAADTRG